MPASREDGEWATLERCGVETQSPAFFAEPVMEDGYTWFATRLRFGVEGPRAENIIVSRLSMVSVAQGCYVVSISCSREKMPR